MRKKHGKRKLKREHEYVWLKQERNHVRVTRRGMDYYSAGLGSIHHTDKEIQSGLAIQRMKRITKGNHWVKERKPNQNTYRYYQKPYIGLPF